MVTLLTLKCTCSVWLFLKQFYEFIIYIMHFLEAILSLFTIGIFIVSSNSEVCSIQTIIYLLVIYDANFYSVKLT